ncbi:MAG: hypothetical protein DCC57_16950 [Chloroflexi bacterium]|nr:MAG: hypothetical protein DCC57_16950 [Chloroflexota bacterium]
MKLTNPLSNRSSLHPAAERGAARRQWLFLARVVVLVAVVVLGYKLLRAGLFGLAAYHQATELRALRDDGDLDSADLARAASILGEAYRSVAALEQEMRLFAPALHAARLLPWVGPTLAATPELLVAGRESVALAAETLQLIAPAAAAQPAAPMPEVLLAAIAAGPDPFAALSSRAGAASRALASIPAARLIGPLAEPVAQAQSALALVADGLTLAPVLPKLLGMYGAQTYLLLVQNNQELRATGGFISAVGQVTINQGRIEGLEIADSYTVARNDVDHPRSPEPQERYMGIPLVFLRDANWSPDFPTTALLARSLYAQDAGVPVDGVATIDLRAVQLLVGALGPLEVEGADEPVTGANIVEQVQRFWDQPLETDLTIENAGQEWWKQRKDFMPILAQAALGRLQSGHFNPLALADAAEASLAERAVQVWMVDEDAAERLAALGWDGGLHPLPGADYVALVDTNMGYNKVNAVLKRATYTDMVERCYFNYVRLYVPGGSELVSVDGVEADSASSQAGERGTQVFAGYFVQEPGSEHTVIFRYRLPPEITPTAYRLVVQRQSGSGPLPLTVQAGDTRFATTLVEARLEWTPNMQTGGE